MNSPSDSPADSHYFTESPSTASKRQQFSVVVAGRELILTADAGVFSQHGLDKGTAVLLDAMEKENPVALAPGSVLCDLGCGSGVIALALAVLYPECTILAVDVNERARNLCAENARTNKLSNITVAEPSDVDESIELAAIWSNPPIRIGKDALHELLLTWLSRLTPSGQARLVVSKNLGADSLTSWLNNQGFPTNKIASSKGFRILAVQSHQ